MYYLEDNMIGGCFPFFMTNEELGTSGFVYQIGSPSYNRQTLRPYISMFKVCDMVAEREDKSAPRDNDILVAILDEQYKESLRDEEGNIDRSKVNFPSCVKRMVDIKGTRVIPNQMKDGFPLIEINTVDTTIQANLLVNLRNSLRWKKYSIKVGNKVDVLWSHTKYAVFEICGDSDNFWLKPVGIYKNTDILMKDNLYEDGCMPEFEDRRYEKRVSDLLNGIKSLEHGFVGRP